MLHKIIKVTPSFLYLFSVSTEIPSFLEGVFSTKSSFDQYQSAILIGESSFHSDIKFVNWLKRCSMYIAQPSSATYPRISDNEYDIRNKKPGSNCNLLHFRSFIQLGQCV